jgi:predicted hotdog family 3-hydroxylacyl-ACP dehydratase
VSAAPLERDWLVAHLPHQGRMNLLEAIVSWDENGLRARASSHRAADNPLRRDAMLPIACGIEYGAQAVAAHGALTSPEGRAGAGFLASARSVAFHAPRLDDIPEALLIDIEKLGGGTGGMLYRFRLSGAERVLVEGRLAIVLDTSHFPVAS